LLLEGAAARFAVLSAEGALFVYGGSRERFRGLEWVGHTLLAVLVLTFLEESFGSPRVAFDPLAWSQLASIVLALAASRFATPRWALAYRLGAHVLFLVWLAKELGPYSTGTGVVTLAWGLYGAAL